MPLLKDWEKDIKAMTPSRAGELYEALLTLGTWDMFKKAFYNGQGLATLSFILKARHEHPKKTVWYCAGCGEYSKETPEAERCPNCGSHQIYGVYVCAHRFKYMGEVPCSRRELMTGPQMCVYCGAIKDEVLDFEL